MIECKGEKVNQEITHIGRVATSNLRSDFQGRRWQQVLCSGRRLCRYIQSHNFFNVFLMFSLLWSKFLKKWFFLYKASIVVWVCL